MIYATKGAFIQALKDINYLKEKIDIKQQELKRYEYLRYGKIKSPLDYDVVGYKNKETIRSLKGRSAINADEINERNEFLDNQITKCKEKIKCYKEIIDRAYKDLSEIKEPLKSIIISRFINKKKLKYVCKKFSQLCFDESGMYKYIMRELDKYYN